MRPEAQKIGGYYACPPEAISAAAKWLVPPAAGDAFLLDPCAGEGDAIKHLGELLGLRPDSLFAIELEDLRGDRLRETLPGSKVLAPASFFGTDIRHGSFSLIWNNPPFDDSLGGGRRVELDFLGRGMDLLVNGGLMLLVCPERVAKSGAVQRVFMTWCNRVRVWPFPAECRKYGEVIIFGIKRDKARPESKHAWVGAPPTEPYQIPTARGPGNRFTKTKLTDAELIRLLAASPLRRRLEPPADRELPRPPLALGAGHLALLLASGHLDGLVKPEDDVPHVVRGTAVKVAEETDKQTEETKGTVTTVTTMSERILLTVRVATSDGRIVTLTQQ